MKFNLFDSSSKSGKVALVSTGALLFAGAYYQTPLFSKNQNTYLLNGLARAGYGNLSSDWLANQTDHIPLFSRIVSVVERLDAHGLFYALLFLF